MEEETFNRLYKQLNKEQKVAVDAIDGPVMVVAGPGTGKTTILTLRIANILKKTDTPPDAILALTFTESGAHAMRRKLVEIVGSRGYKVNISTFHGFCNGIIKEYPERFPRVIGSVAMSELDQIKTIESILNNGDFELLRPYGDPMYYVRPALSAIRALKREGYGPDDLKKNIKDEEKRFAEMPDLYHEKGAHKGKMKGEYIKTKERILKNKELLKLFCRYEEILAEKKLYDYEDMILQVIRALRENPEFLLILQESFQYILADEHQDANNAQNGILELLSDFHKNPNLFIVGDEKQAIFRFQGASLENFLYFKKLYPKASLINLEENYRSSQYILNASHSLIEKNTAPEIFTRVRLKSNIKHSVPISIREFRKESAEHFFVASDIKAKISAGAKPEDFAVLYRDNRDAFRIAEALEKIGVPYRIESDQDILRNSDINKLVLILRALNDISDDKNLAKILFIDFIGLDNLEVFKVIKTAGQKRQPLHFAVAKTFLDFWKKFARWSGTAKNKPLVEIFEMIVRESGFLADALQSDRSSERLCVLDNFFNEIRKLSSGAKEYYLSDFIEYLDLIEEHGVLMKGGTGSDQVKSARLMTAHKSKGLEFENVYIVGACDGHWGNKKERKYFHLNLLGGDDEAGAGKLEDERRLFYVALTRAKKNVSVSYAKEGEDGKERLASQFLDEIDGSYKTIEDVSGFEKSFEKTPLAKFGERVSPKISVSDRDYIKGLFLEQGLNVSALNNFLDCPWRYFFISLIRLPQSPTKHQIYGTSVHETLQIFFNKYRADINMTKKELIGLFEHNLGKKPLNEIDYKELLLKGRKSIGGWFETYKNSWPRQLITEFSIRGVHFPVAIGKEDINVILSGKLDKVEISGNGVNVVDYKTGKPKSRNALEGKTKDADGNYKRQLVFYKLLLDLDHSAGKIQKYKMQTGELDFIEPDDRMRYKKERFEITETEVSELKKTIAEVSAEIMSFNFSEKACSNKNCEWCALGKLITKARSVSK